MNASKEQADEAARLLDGIAGLVRNPELDNVDRENIRSLIQDVKSFLLVAKRKLPSEESYAREKERRERQPKYKSSRPLKPL